MYLIIFIICRLSLFFHHKTWLNCYRRDLCSKTEEGTGVNRGSSVVPWKPSDWLTPAPACHHCCWRPGVALSHCLCPGGPAVCGAPRALERPCCVSRVWSPRGVCTAVITFVGYLLIPTKKDTRNKQKIHTSLLKLYLGTMTRLLIFKIHFLK